VPSEYAPFGALPLEVSDLRALAEEPRVWERSPRTAEQHQSRITTHDACDDVEYRQPERRVNSGWRGTTPAAQRFTEPPGRVLGLEPSDDKFRDRQTLELSGVVYVRELASEIVTVRCSPGSRSLHFILGDCTGHLRIGAEQVVDGEVSWALTHPRCHLKPICIEVGGIEQASGVGPALRGQCLEEAVKNRSGRLGFVVVLRADSGRGAPGNDREQ